MTRLPAQVRARTLIEEYLDLKYEINDADMTFNVAKHCALVTVKEIIDATSGVRGDYATNRYWIKVRAELMNICEDCY